VANLFADAGIIVISAFISPYGDDRVQARSLNDAGRFFEVYCKCSLETCETRDPKGLYKKARKGEVKGFTGVTAPYEEPENADIVVETDRNSLDECVDQILGFLEKQGVIPGPTEG
jgi:adenylylsulfate kinase